MARILVIDDNDQFRNMLCEMLKNEGYDIMSAHDGKRGMALYRQDPADLIITDINMPEKSGPELIFELKRDFPDVRIIAISGGSDHSEAYLKDIASFTDGIRVFTKPLDMDEVLEAIKEAVA